MEFLVNYGEKCFLCQQQIGNGQSSDKHDIMSINFKTILRYFEIDDGHFLEGLWTKEQIELQKTRGLKYTGIFCKKCWQFTNNLNSLIHDLDIIQKEINKKLKLFHKSLSCNSKVNGVVEDSELATKFRKELEGKCHKFAPVSLAHLKVEYLQKSQEFDTSENAAQFTSSNLLNKEIGHTSSDSAQNPTVEANNNALDTFIVPVIKCVKGSSNTIPVSVTTIFRKLKKYYSAHNSGKLKCKLCHKLIHKKRRNVHMTVDHPEKLFPVATTGISEERFQNVCLTLMEKEGQNNDNDNSTTTESRKILVCKYCSRNFANRQNFKHHLIVNHHQQLSKAVEREIGTGKFISEREYIADKTGNGTKTFEQRFYCRRGHGKKLVCSYCKQRFTRLSKLKVHTVHQHGDKHFSECHPNNLSAPEFNDVIQEALKKVIQLCENVNKEGKQARKCPFCSSMYRYTEDMKIHLAFGHRKEILHKIRGFSSSSAEEEEAEIEVDLDKIYRETLVKHQHFPKCCKTQGYDEDEDTDSEINVLD